MISDRLKKLADRFACAWCYDWGGGRIFVAGKADSLRNIESNTYELKSSTWALNLEDAELELSREIHCLTQEDLELESFPMGMGGEAPGEYVDFEQSGYPLFSNDNHNLLDAVPEIILKKAVKMYFDKKGCLGDYFTEDDPYEYALPNDLHPKVYAVLERLCCAESKRLMKNQAAHERKIRQFDLIIHSNPPTRVKTDQPADDPQGVIGSGIGVFNGMPQSGSSGLNMQASSLKASSFKKWIETMTVKGYEVCSAKGVFAGEEAEGHLLVAVFGISRQETESAAVGRENFKGIQDFAAHCKASEWTVQIAASNSVAFWHLVPAINQLQAQAKGVRFEIHHAQTREMVNATREGVFDIAFVREDAIPAGMKSASLGSVGRSLLIPKALAPTRPKTLAAALVSIPMALPIGGSVRDKAEQLAAKTGKPLKIVLGCTSYIQAARALETESCGTVLPDLAKPSLKLEKFHVFALPEKYDLCMAWSKRNTDTRPQLLSLIDTMQGVLKLSGK